MKIVCLNNSGSVVGILHLPEVPNVGDMVGFNNTEYIVQYRVFTEESIDLHCTNRIERITSKNNG
jgi:hypothetical protein